MKFGGTFIAATVVAVLLGGCSEDPTPKEPTARPAPTVTATPPEMPAQAREDSPEGAAAFVDYWVDVFNYASQTGDVDGLRKVSDEDCEGCQRYIRLYRDTYSSGGYFHAGSWNLGELNLREGDLTFVSVAVSAGSATVQADRNSRPKEQAAYKETVTFLVKYDDAWTLKQIGSGGV